MKYYFKCPKCGADDGFSSPAEQSSGLGCLLLLAGGYIAALLYEDAQSRRVQCDHCGYLFRQPALPKTGVAKLATVIVLIHVAAFAAVAVLIWLPELAERLPIPQFVEDVVLRLSGQTAAMVVIVGIAAGATLCVCVIAAAASSVAQRRRMSREFELRPKASSGARHGEEHAGHASSEPAPRATPHEP